jgi:hypothetical protein
MSSPAAGQAIAVTAVCSAGRSVLFGNIRSSGQSSGRFQVVRSSGSLRQARQAGLRHRGPSRSFSHCLRSSRRSVTSGHSVAILGVSSIFAGFIRLFRPMLRLGLRLIAAGLRPVAGRQARFAGSVRSFASSGHRGSLLSTGFAQVIASVSVIAGHRGSVQLSSSRSSGSVSGRLCVISNIRSFALSGSFCACLRRFAVVAVVRSCRGSVAVIASSRHRWRQGHQVGRVILRSSAARRVIAGLSVLVR